MADNVYYVNFDRDANVELRPQLPSPNLLARSLSTSAPGVASLPAAAGRTN